MTNPQSVPSTAAGLNATKSTPFRRAKQMLAAIAQANTLIGITRQMALENIGSYWSRGKGKGKKARSAKKPGRRSFNYYPFSSARQHAKTARTQHMVMVNGFPLMQTIPARDRKSASIARAA